MNTTEELTDKEKIAIEIAKEKILEERNRIVVLNELQRIEGLKMIYKVIHGI